MARSTDRLQVRVLEGRSAASDLHPMVHLEIPRPMPRAAESARVPVPQHDERPRGVPEVVSVKLPPASTRAVRAAPARQCVSTFDAPTGPSCLGTTPNPIREPGGREGEDPTVGTDLNRGGLPAEPWHRWGLALPSQNGSARVAPRSRRRRPGPRHAATALGIGASRSPTPRSVSARVGVPKPIRLARSLRNSRAQRL